VRTVLRGLGELLTTGQPFAFIGIPAFGPHWRFTIIQGTALAQLNVSPGHVPGTQLPGQVGNFAVAGGSGCSPGCSCTSRWTAAPSTAERQRRQGPSSRGPHP
jgi:hypothetical protein